MIGVGSSAMVMEAANGKAEKIGELRGELKSLIKDFYEWRKEDRSHHLIIETRIAELATQWSNHAVLHSTLDHEDIRRDHRTMSIRNAVQLVIMAIAVAVSLTLGLLSIFAGR